MRLALAVMVLAIAARGAAAQPVDHAALGAQAFADGKLDEALRELEAAYREDPDPNLLFALGRVHSARGDCVRAVDHYRRYLESQPGQKGADAAQAEIDKCQAATPPDDHPPAGDALPAQPEVPPPTIARAAPRRGFASAMIHDRFVQVGLAAGVVAGGLFVYALRTACWDGVCEVGDGVDYDEFTRRRDLAPELGVASAVVGGVAGALIVTGIVRYATRDDDDARFEAAIAPRRGGGEVVLSGRF
jgi:tetratricopeptide (TPR) repeat protein